MGNWLFVGMSGCTEIGVAGMALISLALLFLSPLILLLAAVVFKRYVLAIAAGLLWLGIGVYCSTETSASAGAYTDIWAIYRFCCFGLSALSFSARWWIPSSEAAQMAQEADEPVSEDNSFAGRQERFEKRTGTGKKRDKPPEF